MRSNIGLGRSNTEGIQQRDFLNIVLIGKSMEIHQMIPVITLFATPYFYIIIFGFEL